MSEHGRARAARVKRGWAAPGGSHDRVVESLKIVLPALIGVVFAFLVFSPLEEKQEVSFLLDKNKVGTAEERLKVSAAQYRGQDDAGRPFVLSRPLGAAGDLGPAGRRDQRHVRRRYCSTTARPASGPNRARYNMDNDHVDVVGPILFTAADGYRMGTRDVTVDMRARTLVSRGARRGADAARALLGRPAQGQPARPAGRADRPRPLAYRPGRRSDERHEAHSSFWPCCPVARGRPAPSASRARR